MKTVWGKVAVTAVCAIGVATACFLNCESTRISVASHPAKTSTVITTAPEHRIEEDGFVSVPPNLTVAPFSLSVSRLGHYTRGYPWTLSISPDRKAILIINTPFEPTVRGFEITEEQRSVLLNELWKEHFFELADEYGQDALDENIMTITASLGQMKKTVTLKSLANWSPKVAARVRESQGVVRVVSFVRAFIYNVFEYDVTR